MDDRELGRAIEDAVWPGAAFRWPDDICVQLGAAARALLVKPVAMREAVKTLVWAQLPHPLKCPNSQGMIYGGEIEDVIADIVLAALSHFAPPKTMIQGMSVERIAAEMRTERRNFPSEYRWDHDDAARVAHRLANTPVPEHDPDLELGREILKAANAKLPEGRPGLTYTDDYARAVGHAVAAAKKEAGGE